MTMKTLKERIAFVRECAAAERATATKNRSRFFEGSESATQAAEAAADALDAALGVLFPDESEDENVLAWFIEIRGLLRELPTLLPADEMEITLVGRGDFFGARCSSFAAIADDPTRALMRLRDKMREAVAARRTKDTEPAPPPSVRVG